MTNIDLERAVVIAIGAGITRREQMIAKGQLEQDAEVFMYGRALTQGERIHVDKLFALFDTEKRAGETAALTNQPLKSNPHPGGSPAWWGWHNGYKSAKRRIEAQRRQAFQTQQKVNK